MNGTSLISKSRSVFSALVPVIVFFATATYASALTITPIRFEVKADPGQIVKEEVTLYNEHDTVEKLYVTYANFEATGENGNPTFVDAKDDLGTWMSTPAVATIAPKSSQIVPLTISVPRDASPGGHFAAVFWGTVPPNGNSNQVSIGAKTGVLVLLSVNGAVNVNGGIIEYGTKDHARVYTSLPIAFYYRFQNNGGDRVKPTGNIVMKDMVGLTAARVPGNPVDGNVLPDSTRRIETVWQGKDGSTPVSDADQGNFFTKVGREWRNFAFGYYRANISLSYGTTNQVAVASLGLWVLPWHLTLFVLVVALVAWFLLRKGIKKYNRWVIARAGEMLRNERHEAEK